MTANIDNELLEIERDYLDFLDGNDTYKDKIADLIENEERRLIISVNDIRKNIPSRAKSLLSNAFPEVHACQRALKKCIQNINPDYGKQYEEFFVGFEGSFGAKHVTPRSLTSSFLGNMVCLEGIVIKCSLVRPKLVRSVHFCPATKKTTERRYTDMTDLDAFPSTGIYPHKDEDGNLLETEYGLSHYKNHQVFTVQEMPEKAPAGQLPRSVDVIADHDLVDSCKPGDRIQIVGQFRCLPSKKNGYTTATFRTILIANNVLHINKEENSGGLMFSDRDVGVMRRLSKRKDVFNLLSRSLAPSIHGHIHIKDAVLCLLLGGVERTLDNGTRIRGDINVLLLGDPSVAKSQFLRFVLNVANNAIATTGRGSSGVGLTAAVTSDPETGERQLEAGAMVLADRGIVCIDEFDKMSDIDRTAIHEVMEQGRVTIAKAGIQAKLNARCSVLAAANPVYGRYDQYKSPMENIGMQDSLLSRFDLLFIVLDKMDQVTDRAIAEHVLRMHRYRPANQEDGEAIPLTTNERLLSTHYPNAQGNDVDAEEEEESSEGGVFEEHNRLLHGSGSKLEYLRLKFVQKYIMVARQIRPRLSRDAADLIAEKYCDLRTQDAASSLGGSSTASNMKRTQPITARTLETLIRLSTAFAKARMSKNVSKDDAKRAADLVSFAIFKEVLEKSRRKREHDGSEDEDESSEDDEEEENSQNDAEKRPGKSPLRKRRSVAPTSMASTSAEGDTVASVPEGESASVLSDADYGRIKTLVSRVFQEKHSEFLPIKEVVSAVRTAAGDVSVGVIKAALQKMHDDAKIMLTSSEVYLI